MNIPNNLRELQCFLGSIQYFRHLLPLKPGSLISILGRYSSEGKFVKDKQFIETFNELKISLAEISTYLPFKEQTCVIFTDASKGHYGGVLFSVSNEGIVNNLSNSLIDEKLVNRNNNNLTSLKVIQNHPLEWVKNLQPVSNSKSLVRILCHHINFLDTVAWEPAILKGKIQECIYHLGAEYQNMVGFTESLSDYEIETKRKQFFNNMQLKDFEKDMERPLLDVLETLYMKAFCKLFSRDIILLNDQSYCTIGYAHMLRSPVILYFSKTENEYVSLTSPAPFLNYRESLKKTVEHFSTEDLAKQIFRILKDENARDLIRPVAYHTKNFNATELSKPIYIKELKAIYNCMKFFADSVRENRCILLTDSLPATQIFRSAKTKDSVVYSILVKLTAEYPNLSINFTPGHSNLADIFSRPCGEENILNFSKNHVPRWNTSSEEYIFFNTISDWLDFRKQEKLAENNDTSDCKENSHEFCVDQPDEKSPSLLELRKIDLGSPENEKIRLTPNERLPSTLLGGPISLNHAFNHMQLSAAYTAEELKDYSKRFSERRGIFMSKDDKIVLPESAHYAAIGNAHVLRGHCGADKLWNFLRSIYHFSNKMEIRRKIDNFTRACIACISANPQKIPYLQGSQYLTVTKPRTLISADVMEFLRLPNSSLHNYHARAWLVISDHYSQFTSGFPLNNINESEITRSFLAYFSNFGVPEKLLTDNAKPFQSASLAKLLKTFGVQKIQSAVYNSKSRASIERRIGTLRKIVRLLNSNGMLQDNIAVARAIRIFNTQPLGRNQFSPIEIHYSYSAENLAFLSNYKWHPYNITRKRINLDIRRVKQAELEIRRREWEKANQNRKTFTGEVGDICVLRAKNQNKSKELFGSDLWRIVERFTYTAKLARVSDLLTQVRSAKEIKVVFSPSRDKKLPKELLEKFDLVDYDKSVLTPQEDLLIEPRMTRSKAKSLESELELDSEEEENQSYYEKFESPNPIKKSVAFNDNVQTRYINSIYINS